MSDLFGNTLSTLPKWMSPSEYSLASEQASASIGHNFTAAFNAAANRKQEQSQFDTLLPIKQRESDARIQGELLDNAIKETDLRLKQQDQAVFGQWMLDHPTVQSRWTAEPPQFSTSAGAAMFANSRAADAGTALGMTLKSDKADFAKRMAVLNAEDRADIMSMSDDPNTGLPTKQKWQALGMAEQRMKVEQQRIAEEKTIAPAQIRAESAENIAEIKGKYSLQEVNARLEAAKNKPVKAFQSPAAKAAYDTELRVIEKDDSLSLEDKFSKIAQLEKNFKVNNPENPQATAVTQPATTGKIVIQNGWRYQLNQDGSATPIGPVQ